MGKATVAGGKVGMKIPFTGILASYLAVGSSVYLNENGSPVEYLVVNQGIPSGSSLYDSSCDGTWLLRKDIHSTIAWGTTDNDYEKSSVHPWLNSTFLNLLDSNVQSAIKQVKIPYQNGTGSGGSISSGSNGLSTKVFLLGGYEVGCFPNNDSYGYSYLPVDGACLDYFSGTSPTDSKRIGYYDDTASPWWLRSASTEDNNYVWVISTLGNGYSSGRLNTYGVRPALILPSTAYFDEETLLFKGVS